MPVRELHHVNNGEDVLVRHILMKQVAHRIDEDHFRCMPAQRFSQLLGYEPQVKSLFIGMTWNATETLGKGFSVAMHAPGTDLCTSPNRVPCCIGPFDCRATTHM